MVKTAFVTCVQLGLSCIEEVYKQNGNFDLLITLEDELATKKSGRIYLDELAAKHNVPLLKIKNINQEEVIKAIEEYDIDWLFIIGWSQIAKNKLLDAPKQGCIGMHPTLLPIGRGRAAIPWAILKGLSKTGVTMFKLDEGVDTGDIIDQVETSIDSLTNATMLYDEIDKLHVELMANNWADVMNGTLSFAKQDHNLATIWEGRTPADGELFEHMTIGEVDKLIRATTRPYPGAFIKKDDKKITIWQAATSEMPADLKFKDGYIRLIDFEEENL